MNRIKTALFIDFDNVYLSLFNDYSESVARRFANPSRWMPWLEVGAYVTEPAVTPGHSGPGRSPVSGDLPSRVTQTFPAPEYAERFIRASAPFSPSPSVQP